MSRTRAELRAAIWRHPAGTPVTVRRDDGSILQTVTRSGAEVVGGQAVVLVEGVSGAFALERVTPVTLTAEVRHG